MSGSAAGLILQVRATLPEQPGSIAGPTLVVIGTSHRYEWILVGSNPRNTRFVVLDRVVSQPSP